MFPLQSLYFMILLNVLLGCYGQLVDRIEALGSNDLLKSPIIQSLIKDLQDQKEKLNAQHEIITKLAGDMEAQAAALLQKDRTITSLQTDVERIKATADKNKAITAELFDEVRELKRSKDTNIEQKQKSSMSEQKSSMSEQAKENEHLKAELAELEKEENTLKKYTDDKHFVKTTNKNVFRHNISIADETESRVYVKGQHQFLRRSANVGQVAFHARCEGGSISHLGLDQTIIFETELLDLGGGYHSATGIFSAPKSGLYLFSVSVCSKFEFNAVIVKNGVWSAAIGGHGGNNIHELDQGSATVVMQLNTGDDVWVRNAHINDATITGYGYTTFTGVLISDI